MKKTMKTIYKSSLLLLAAILFLPAAMKGQNTGAWGPKSVMLNKTIDRTADNQFAITMESYVAGEGSQSTEELSTDIVIVMDASNQMNEAYANGTVYIPVNSSFTLYGMGVGYGEEHAPTEYFRKVGDNYYPVYATHHLSIIGTPLGASLYYKNGSSYTRFSRVSDYITSIIGGLLSTIFSRYATVYQGTLYRKVSSKLIAEKTAAQIFIDAIKADAVDGKNHKVSIVKFAGDYYSSETYLTSGNHDGYTEVVSNFMSINGKTTVTEQGQSGTEEIDNDVYLKKLIEDIKASGSANADKGVRKAELLLGSVDDTNPKLVVFFTGSVPSDNNRTSKDIADAAIAYSKRMKDTSVTVLTIGMFTGNESSSISISNYLNGVSSNYPQAVDLDNLGTGSDRGYYLQSESGNLNALIQNLLDKTKENISIVTYPLGTDAEILDYLTGDFRMAETPQLTVTAQKYNGLNNGVPSWEDVSLPDGVQSSIITENNKKVGVRVSGFDFADNYVGTFNDHGTIKPHGMRLVVSFNVEIDPSCAGGKSIPSNQLTSGVYVPEDGTQTQIAGFNVPTANIPNIIISKTGLKAGESALFNVYKKTGTNTYGNPIQVWVTGDGENAVTTTVKYLEPGTYKVEETGWSWSYTAATTQQEKTIGSDDNTTFSFTNTPKTGTPAHGEAATGNNVFAK